MIAVLHNSVQMAKHAHTQSQALSRAFSAYNAGKLIEAEQICQQITNSKPNLFDALHLLAVVQSRLGKMEEALASYDRALQVRPDYAEALYNRGTALSLLGRFEEALASYDRALKVRPDYAEALRNRGLILHKLKRFEEALASYDDALKVRPDCAEALTNRGGTLCELKQFEAALATYDHALTLRPDYAEAHFSEALCRLLLGDFGRGWEKNEWRLQARSLRIKRNFAQPQWTGQEDIAGKAVLLHAEQGFGDTIQFCRYVPLVGERAAHVILEVQRPLHELMNTLPGGPQIVVRGDPLSDFDLHCPLLSLPLAFETQLETIPFETPYLRASSERVMSWNARLGPNRPRIGLAWSGHPSNWNDHPRPVPQSRSAAQLHGRRNYAPAGDARQPCHHGNRSFPWSCPSGGRCGLRHDYAARRRAAARHRKAFARWLRFRPSNRSAQRSCPHLAKPFQGWARARAMKAW
jgi:Tfp pilus assembly protein PilF